MCKHTDVRTFSAVQCETEKIQNEMINVTLQTIQRCIFPHQPNMNS